MQVAILGAGPAGMTCANALLTFGINALVIERDALPGGAQRTNFHPNLWLLGNPEETGREVTERMVRHFRQLPIPLYLNANIQRITRPDVRFSITFDSPDSDTSSPQEMHQLEADAIVLATGMRPRATPDLFSLARTNPRVIIGPLSDAIRDDIRDARVLILGGGDNALDHALYLAGRNNRVTVCARATFTARPGFMSDCSQRGQIELRHHCPQDTLTTDDHGIRHQGKFYDWLLVMYGYQPNTEVLECFAQKLRPCLTESGHIATDTWQRTSVPGLYAAGDITESVQPSVASAIAQGLAAARAMEREMLKKIAVGEIA